MRAPVRYRHRRVITSPVATDPAGWRTTRLAGAAYPGCYVPGEGEATAPQLRPRSIAWPSRTMENRQRTRCAWPREAPVHRATGSAFRETIRGVRSAGHASRHGPRGHDPSLVPPRADRVAWGTGPKLAAVARRPDARGGYPGSGQHRHCRRGGRTRRAGHDRPVHCNGRLRSSITCHRTGCAMTSTSTT